MVSEETLIEHFYQRKKAKRVQIQMQLKYSDIPSWLYDSEFYKSLSDDEADSSIDIPTQCYREACEESVQSTEDLANMLKVLRFWGLAQIPQSVLEFCYVKNVSAWEPVFVETVGEGLAEHKAVMLAFKESHKFTLFTALSTTRPEFVTFWLNNNMVSCEQNKDAIAQACGFGRLDLVQTLQERRFKWDDYACCTAAALYGHIHILQYMYENRCDISFMAMIFAARGGQLACLQFVHSVDSLFVNAITLEFAVAAHYQFLKEPGNDTHSTAWQRDFPLAPPADGYLECLRYVLAHGCPIHKNACTKAAQYGLLDCLALLHEYNALWDAGTTTAAAGAGHVHCLQYLHEHQCPGDHRATESAAANGQYVCLVYLHSFIAPVGTGAITVAAGAGQLHCVQFLKEHYYPWCAAATSSAAKQGHLHCLQYLHENGCAWDGDACRVVCLGGHLTCLQYLHEHGCPWHIVDTARAVSMNHLDCLQYLHVNGCPWDKKTALCAAGHGYIDCLRYVVENDCPFDDIALLSAAARAVRTQGLKYLIEERRIKLSAPLSGAVFGVAFCQAHVANVKYLVDIDYPFKSYVFQRPTLAYLVPFSDVDFRQCIKYAVEHGWQDNQELYDFVSGRNWNSTGDSGAFLPLCQAYLNERKKMS